MDATALLAAAAGLGLGLLAGWAVWGRGTARAEALLEAERRSGQERLDQMREAFKALSADVLRDNARTFLDLARGSLEEKRKEADRSLESLVAPVRETLGKVDARLQEMETRREGAYRGIEQMVKGMVAAQDALRTEAARLVQALRPSHGRGRWGEIHLQRLVELAEMVEHCDFEAQVGSAGPDDQLRRPDLLVRLPGGKTIVVDAKVPLQKYLDALEATEDAAREACLAEHARQVRERFRELSAKAYWSQFPDAPDFVVMYVPDEAFLSEAVRRAPDLLEDAWRRKVIPAGPTVLMTLFKTVHYVWQQEALNEKTREVADLGRTLYERLAELAANLAGVGKGIEGAVDAYNRAVTNLERRVLPSARRLKLDSSRELAELPAVEQPVREIRSPELQGTTEG